MQEDVYRGEGQNLYAYCENNPVMYDGPSGYSQSDNHLDEEDTVNESTTELWEREKTSGEGEESAEEKALYNLRVSKWGNKEMEKIKKFIWFVVAILVYTVVFNGINPMALFRLKQGVVSASKIEKHPDADYIGYKAGKDIPRAHSKEDLETIEGYMTIDATHAIALDLYKIKNKQDMENLKYSRNAKGRKVYHPSTKVPEYTHSPGERKGFYNPFYLVELEDGTYVVAYLEDVYGEKIEKGQSVTLPIGKMMDMPSQVDGELSDFKEIYDINEGTMLCCFSDERFIKHEDIEIYIRGGASIIVVLIMYGIICKLFPKLKISFD